MINNEHGDTAPSNYYPPALKRLAWFACILPLPDRWKPAMWRALQDITFNLLFLTQFRILLKSRKHTLSREGQRQARATPPFKQTLKYTLSRISWLHLSRTRRQRPTWRSCPCQTCPYGSKCYACLLSHNIVHAHPSASSMTTLWSMVKILLPCSSSTKAPPT